MTAPSVPAGDVAKLVEELRARIGEEFDGELHLAEEEANQLFDATESLSRDLAEARAALGVCQSALAMMIAPDAIKQTTVIHAFAAATEAEARARSVLSTQPKETPDV